MLTCAEVAERLVVSVKTVRGLIRRGELVAYMPAGKIRVSPEDLESYLGAQRVVPLPTARREPRRRQRRPPGPGSVARLDSIERAAG